MRLKGKSIVITGATGGIGSETAKVFKSNGAKLALLGRDKNKLDELQNELGEDLSTQNDLIINIGSDEGNKSPSLITSFGRFDEITMEFDEILKPGKIEPGLFKIKSRTSSYRVRQASVSKKSKQVLLELKDDLPTMVGDLTISYLDLPGDQRTGVIQSDTGLDASTITGSNVFVL